MRDQGRVWHLYGRVQGRVRHLYGRVQGRVLHLYGRVQGRVWHLYGRVQGRVRHLCGSAQTTQVSDEHFLVIFPLFVLYIFYLVDGDGVDTMLVTCS